MNTVTVQILGKPYQLNCPPEQEAQLQEAARQLDARMKDIKTKGNIIGLERIAIISALNLSYEHLELQKTANLNENQQQTISSLLGKVDHELRAIAKLHD